MEFKTKFYPNNEEYELTISLDRFDEDIDVENGAVYHGFWVNIVGNGIDVSAKKSDGEDEMSIQRGVEVTDNHTIEIVREVAMELFNISTLLVLTKDNREPYQKV